MFKTTKIISVLAVLTALAISICGQDESPILIDTNLVNVNVTIGDRSGKYVEGLTRENFEIYDNDILQEISYFSAEEAPISFGIVYDMHPTTDERTKSVLQSLRRFVSGLRSQDDFFTLVFNRRGSLILDFVPSVNQINTHLAGRYREPNALYDAIYAATRKIRDRKNLKRVLLVITDTADHNSEHRFNDILDQFKSVDAKIYTILWDEAEEWNYSDIDSDGTRRIRKASAATNLDRAALQDLALRTGGGMQSPTAHTADELGRIYKQIAFEMRKQYAIGFYPTALDGKTHQLMIKLRRVKDMNGMVLTYRTGYQVRSDQ